jgi:hypothetical protein
MCKLDTLARDTVKWLPCVNAMLNSWTYGREFLDQLNKYQQPNKILGSVLRVPDFA